MSSYRAFIYEDPDNLQYEVRYYHYPKRWQKYSLPQGCPLSKEENWSEEFKYFDSKGIDYSDEIKHLPTNTGGIYVFYLKGINLPFLENYILYVGRCHFTAHQNIRKRAKEYLSDSRALITFMRDQWRDYLYYRFSPDTNTRQIDQNEVCLIRSIAPFFNERIPDNIEIQTPVQAFSK